MVRMCAKYARPRIATQAKMAMAIGIRHIDGSGKGEKHGHLWICAMNTVFSTNFQFVNLAF
jgi:hypothetical protein